ncbi:MAG: ABC transporter permease [Chloroflexi bacterium]|nr:ABC transporter permease [Chloroflexota bacterium]
MRWRRLVSPALVLLLWEGVVIAGIVDPFFLPPPHAVAASLFKLLLSGALLADAGWSLTRLFVGYSLAVISGVTLGILMGWFKSLDDFFDPLVEAVRPISPIALIPLAILWFGIGNEQKVFIIWIATFFPILINTYFGVKATPKVLIRAARTLGARERHMLWKVVIPSALPYIFSALRISMAIGFIVIIASEMVAAKNGLGYMIIDAERVYKTDVMFAGILTISTLGLIFDRILRHVRSSLLPWYQEI